MSNMLVLCNSYETDLAEIVTRLEYDLVRSRWPAVLRRVTATFRGAVLPSRRCARHIHKKLDNCWIHRGFEQESGLRNDACEAEVRLQRSGNVLEFLRQTLELFFGQKLSNQRFLLLLSAFHSSCLTLTTRYFRQILVQSLQLVRIRTKNKYLQELESYMKCDVKDAYNNCSLAVPLGHALPLLDHSLPIAT